MSAGRGEPEVEDEEWTDSCSDEEWLDSDEERGVGCRLEDNEPEIEEEEEEEEADGSCNLMALEDGDPEVEEKAPPSKRPRPGARAEQYVHRVCPPARTTKQKAAMMGIPANALRRLVKAGTPLVFLNLLFISTATLGLPMRDKWCCEYEPYWLFFFFYYSI